MAYGLSLWPMAYDLWPMAYFGLWCQVPCASCVGRQDQQASAAPSQGSSATASEAGADSGGAGRT